MAIRQLLREVRALGVAPRLFPDAREGGLCPFPLRCRVLPPVAWDARLLSQRLGIALPGDLEELWHLASSIRLFEDIAFGQWGFVLWSPDEVIPRHEGEIGWHPDDFRRGDLVVGEFLGDLERVLVRCDPQETDFGSVLITLPEYPREDWYVAASSITDFIREYFHTWGDKYWEVFQENTPARSERTN